MPIGVMAELDAERPVSSPCSRLRSRRVPCVRWPRPRLLTITALAGALGPILVDVRTASRSTPQPAVVVMHGFKGFKDYAFLPPIAERLARAGFTAVNLSVSGSGVDATGEFTLLDRFARNTYTRELGDIELVIRALDRRRARRRTADIDRRDRTFARRRSGALRGARDTGDCERS